MKVVCVTHSEKKMPLTEEAVIECINDIAENAGGYMMLEIDADKIGIRDKRVVFAMVNTDGIVEDMYVDRRDDPEWRRRMRVWMVKKILRRLGVSDNDVEWLAKYNVLVEMLGDYEEMLGLGGDW